MLKIYILEKLKPLSRMYELMQTSENFHWRMFEAWTCMADYCVEIFCSGTYAYEQVCLCLLSYQDNAQCTFHTEHISRVSDSNNVHTWFWYNFKLNYRSWWLLALHSVTIRESVSPSSASSSSSSLWPCVTST